MLIKILAAMLCVLVLWSCSSAQHGRDSAGKALPAPVRESSIIPPPPPEAIVVDSLTEGESSTEEDVAAAVQGVEVHSEEQQNQEASSPQIVATEVQSSEPVVEVVESNPEPPSVVEETVEVVEAQLEPVAEPSEDTETEVEGLVQLALPDDVEVTAGEEEGAESDVATYLLDEAENSFERENYEKARGQSERALTLEPTAARAYLILARVEMAEGRPDQAAEMARQGLASGSDSDEIFEQLNQILGEIAERQESPSLEEGQEVSIEVQESLIPPEGTASPP